MSPFAGNRDRDIEKNLKHGDAGVLPGGGAHELTHFAPVSAPERTRVQQEDQGADAIEDPARHGVTFFARATLTNVRRRPTSAFSTRSPSRVAR